MTIASEITRINNAKAAIKQSLANKGVEVSDEAKLDEYPALIDSIEVGGGNCDPIHNVYEVAFNNKTSQRTNYSSLLKGYTGTELDVSSLDTSNATDMSYMFYNCFNLTMLDVSNWVTGKVTTMFQMFYQCYELDLLGINKWDTSTVTNMYYVFYKCASLTSLDLSNWNTGNVTDMSSMFSRCSQLAELNLSNFDMTKVTKLSNMFDSCNKLHTIRLDNCSNATISKIITSSNFPTNIIEGVTRTIYCKEENAAGLVAPTNWVFSYIVEELPEAPEQIICDICGDPACEYPSKGDRARCPECRMPYRASNPSCFHHSTHYTGGNEGGY